MRSSPTAVLPRSTQGVSEHQPGASASSSQQGASGLSGEQSAHGPASSLREFRGTRSSASTQVTGATAVSRIRPENPRSLGIRGADVQSLTGGCKPAASIRPWARGVRWEPEPQGSLGNREHQEIAPDQGGFSNGRRKQVLGRRESRGAVLCGPAFPRYAGGVCRVEESRRLQYPGKKSRHTCRQAKKKG